MPYKDPEKRKAYWKMYNDCRRDPVHGRERSRLYARNYAKRHPDRVKAARQAYAINHKEKFKAIRKASKIKHKAKILSHILQVTFNITGDQYDRMLEAQHGVCAICFQVDNKGKRLSVDHDHRCCPQTKSCGKCVRGLLCHKCNMAIAFLHDNIKIIESAATYLKHWNQTITSNS